MWSSSSGWRSEEGAKIARKKGEFDSRVNDQLCLNETLQVNGDAGNERLIINQYEVLHQILSHHITQLYHAPLHRKTLFCTAAYLMKHHHVTTRHNTSHDVTPHHTISQLMTLYSMTSCPVTSYLITSHILRHTTSHLATSDHIRSYHVHHTTLSNANI